MQAAPGSYAMQPAGYHSGSSSHHHQQQQQQYRQQPQQHSTAAQAAMMAPPQQKKSSMPKGVREFVTSKKEEKLHVVFFLVCLRKSPKESLITVFENHRKSIIQHCERSELRLHFE